MSISENISQKMFLLLNVKPFKELSNNMKKFLKSMFGEVFETEVIKCHLNSSGKTNLIIEKNGEIKRVSIINKRFSKRERVYDFINFLRSIDVSFEVIKALLTYHFSYGNDNICGMNLITAYEDKIKIVDEEFKNLIKLEKVIKYIFATGNIDFFYYGDERLGIVIEKEKFIDTILHHQDNYVHNYMRIGVFNISPISRMRYQKDVLKNI